MKILRFVPLLFLAACSAAPRLVLRPQPPANTDISPVRYPEVVRAYRFGRYIDPSDDMVLHEEHVVYRVEENTRWNLHPVANGNIAALLTASMPRDAAFNPVPVNDDILAEVNSQRLATAQIISEARILSAALGQFQAALQQTKTNLLETARLRRTVDEMQKRLDALESAPAQSPAASVPTTNEPPDSLGP
jgi:hypothetical protein